MSGDKHSHEHDTACSVVTDQQRAAPRKPVLMPGEVSFGDKRSRVACSIVDMSATGARLKMAAIDRRLQHRVGLYFDQQTTLVECQIIWVHDSDIGVRFCSAFMRQDQRS